MILLRHIFLKLDGTTAGPSAFNGEIGKILQKSCEMPFTIFNSIKIDLEFVVYVADNLSTDQKYFFEISQAISNGCCSPHLAQQRPGTLNHARWLTMANNLLRLYVATENLLQLVKFVMKVYAPTWYDIKFHYHFQNASIHFMKIIQRCPSARFI